MDKFKFYKENSFEERQKVYEKMTKKHARKIPIIVQANEKKMKLDGYKFCVPSDINMGQLLYIVRQRIQNLNKEEALFMYVINESNPKGILVPVAKLIAEVYDLYHSECGFLYIYVDKENTFGTD